MKFVAVERHKSRPSALSVEKILKTPGTSADCAKRIRKLTQFFAYNKLIVIFQKHINDRFGFLGFRAANSIGPVCRKV